MSDWEVLFAAPLGLLFAGALVVLALERAGTPVGARKTGSRTHMAVIIILACVAAMVQWTTEFFEITHSLSLFGGSILFDRSGLLMALGITATGILLTMSANARLRDAGMQRGELFAFIGIWIIFDVVAVFADDLLLFGAATLGSYLIFAAMSSTDRGVVRNAETSVKIIYSAGGMLILIVLAALFVFAHTGQTTLSALALAPRAPIVTLAVLVLATVALAFALAVPLHLAHTDAVQGAPPFASALFISGAFSKSTLLFCRLQESITTLPDNVLDLFDGFVVVALLLPGLIALDQRQISRVLAQLLGGASVVMVAAARLQEHTMVVATGVLIAFAGAAAFCTLGVIERPGRELTTWEGMSGAGKTHPYFVLAFLWILASLVGFPGTALFSLRLKTAKLAFSADHFFMGASLIFSIAVASAPVFRLGILAFARSRSKSLYYSRVGFRSAANALFAVALILLSVGTEPAYKMVRDWLLGLQ